MKQKIAVVDYGMGNLRSVSKALEHVAPQAEILLTDAPDVIHAADKVVFPGQGAMRDCMAELDARGLRAAVQEAAASKPFLGICIGQQMLFAHSEEMDTPGLGILPGNVVRFPAERMFDAAGTRLKVPHMGWSEVWHHALTRSGKTLPMASASISCTAILLIHRTGNWSPANPITRSALPVR
jgi:glutamine amidotransferase